MVRLALLKFQLDKVDTTWGGGPIHAWMYVNSSIDTLSYHVYIRLTVLQWRRSQPPHYVRLPLNPPPLRPNRRPPSPLQLKGNQHGQVQNRPFLEPRATNDRRNGREVGQPRAVHQVRRAFWVAEPHRGWVRVEGEGSSGEYGWQVEQ